MPLPEFVTPVLSIAGPAALVFVILRSFPQAGIVAIVTRDKERRESCHAVLDKVTRHDAGPPRPPRSLSPPRKSPGR